MNPRDPKALNDLLAAPVFLPSVAELTKYVPKADSACACASAASAAAIPATRPTAPKVISLVPQQVIFNPPATIVYWKDGDKTVVRCDNDEFSEEFGFAMACMRKIYGTRANFKAQFKDAYRPQAKKATAKLKEASAEVGIPAPNAPKVNNPIRIIKKSGNGVPSLDQLLKELAGDDSIGVEIEFRVKNA